MGVEIERRFLVKDGWQPTGESIHMKQGYLPGTGPMLVRIRIEENKRAVLTLKGRAEGITRSEYEYEIPMQDAEELLLRCQKRVVEKTRFFVTEGDYTWEVDVFAGANTGLVIAELELSDENEVFDRPDWIGAEVSMDGRYYNVNLAEHPFSEW